MSGMTKKLTVLLLWLMLSLLRATAADVLPAVEVKGDRTIIYPQRLELTGEETLMDILEMYPDLMGAGFDDLLLGTGYQDSYQLRLENVAVSADTRLLVTQLKASLISKIQICDNAGVAKGRTGDGRVIDVNLVKTDEGVHGFLSLQRGTDKRFAPSANLRYGSEHTDIWSALTYTYDDADGLVNKAENFHFHMANRFTPRDLLRTYITQSSSISDLTTEGSRSHVRNRSLMARFRYFHTFNELGTELMTMLSWAHQYTPGDTYDADLSLRLNESVEINSPVILFELNTPLFTKNLSLMAGYEFELDVIHHNADDTSAGKNSEHNRYQMLNNDLYVQLNYTLGPLLLTVGDRVMFYHYKQKVAHNEYTCSDTRNNFQASVVLTPRRCHQVQVAYYRKFQNPPVMTIQPLDEIMTNQYRLSYAYSRPTFCAKLDGSIYSGDEIDSWSIDGSAFKKMGVWMLTAGFNVYGVKPTGNERFTFATLRLVPAVRLPQALQLSAKLLWYSTRSPYRLMNENTAFYGSLQVDKQLGRHWSFHAEWHDMFYRHRSAALGGIMYRF